MQQFTHPAEQGWQQGQTRPTRKYAGVYFDALGIPWCLECGWPRERVKGYPERCECHEDKPGS